MSNGNNNNDNGLEFGEQVKVEETPQFTYRPAGITEISLPDGTKGIVFTFTLHAVNDNNMLVHTWNDGSVTPIVMQSAPMIDPVSVKNLRVRSGLMIPNQKPRLIH